MADADISPIRAFLDRLNDQTSSLLARGDVFAGALYLLGELRAPLMNALAVLP